MANPNPISSAKQKGRRVYNRNIYLYNRLEQSQLDTLIISF